MKQNVLDALSGKAPGRIPCKESLNHPGLINHVSGMDVFEDPARAFDLAWRKLSIDIHVPLPVGENQIPALKSGAPVPEGVVRRPKVPGGTWTEGNTRYADLGVFPTSMPLEHLPHLDKSAEDWVYQYDPNSDDFDLNQRIAALRKSNQAFRSHFGDQAVHYHLYYTTLFMWPVVKFDWEPFMMAAGMEPERFDEHFWKPWARISRKQVEAMAAMDEEVIFTHDDLVSGTGPIFPPDFYEKYIFSQYEYIWEPAVRAGKKIVYVIDGNCDVFLERLLKFPIAGLMYENPATPFERVLETWGKAGRGFIGGISTALLTNGTPQQVREHTRAVIEQGRRYPGFIISSCGGLHGNIPLENALAYFEARNEMGIPAQL